MLDIINMISTRLGDDKLTPYVTQRLIKDVSNIIGRGCYFEPANLKPALIQLGWEEDILNYRTLELVCMFLENRRSNKDIDKPYQRSPEHPVLYGHVPYL